MHISAIKCGKKKETKCAIKCGKKKETKKCGFAWFYVMIAIVARAITKRGDSREGHTVR